ERRGAASLPMRRPLQGKQLFRLNLFSAATCSAAAGDVARRQTPPGWGSLDGAGLREQGSTKSGSAALARIPVRFSVLLLAIACMLLAGCLPAILLITQAVHDRAGI